MLKEPIICIVIIISIILGNYIIQNYTKESIATISGELEELKKEVFKKNNEINEEKVEKQIEKVWKQWEGSHDKLAYFIEHNELEKVETNLTALQSFISTKEYKESIKELDEAKFLLNHIQDKYAFNLENIF